MRAVAAFGVAFAVNGLAQATGWPGTTRGMADWTTPQTRGSAMAAFSTCYQVGGFVAVWFAGFLAKVYGWRAAFYGPALVLIAVAVAVLVFFPPAPPQELDPAPPGGVSFDIATTDLSATAPSDYTTRALAAQAIPPGATSYAFDVSVQGDAASEPDETFRVDVTNVVGDVIVGDAQAIGTIVNDDIDRIHDVQGNGATSPIVGATVTVEGVVTASFQGNGGLSGFFLQEEDADADADPNTSEGVFVYCGACPTAVAEGQRVRASGTVSEFFGLTEITASAPTLR